ncbi:MAG: endonuclease/exonuclease/phosphatase family protein [Myxococcota bacterium]
MRVATLNLWNKTGPWQRRMALLGAEARALELDVLCLQEVLELASPTKGEAKLASQLDELGLEGMHRAFGLGHLMKGPWRAAGHELRFGNAVLSRWPIAGTHVELLPGADVSDQRRSLLHAVLARPAGALDVFVTHLNWKADEGHVREAQVAHIAKTIAERAPADGRHPPLLCGDFNAEPGSDEIRFLRGLTRLGGEASVRFVDAWEYAGGAPGHTFDPLRNPFAREYPRPGRRVDYVFVRGPLRAGAGVPRRAFLAFDRPGPDGVHVSDHFGVCVDLRDGEGP